MRRKRKKFSSGFIANVAIEALKERETLSELATRFEVHPNQISSWKQEFLSKADSVFDKGRKEPEEPSIDTEKLYAKIGQLETDTGVLKKKLKEGQSAMSRRELVEPQSNVSC